MSVFRLVRLMTGKDNLPHISTVVGKIRNRLALVGLLTLATGAASAASDAQTTEGKALVMERSRGNCLACHVIADGRQPGNIGPPLVAMKARFPDADILHEQIWDATIRNPDSRMPPFGRHNILSGREIDLIVQYLYTL